MAEARHLRNAPITEALIDLRMTLPPDSTEKLKELTDRIRNRFPKRIEIRHGQFKFQLGPQANAEQMVSGVLGYLCSSTDDTKRVQFRADGFTFNKLKPYEDWLRMRDEARDLWSIYAEAITAGQLVQRVALRYINHLELSVGTRLEDYLTTTPNIPERLPQLVREYLNRLVLNNQSLNAIAIVTQNLQPPKEKGGKMALLLDVDVFRDRANLKPEEAWDLLEEFRKFKNQIFFESITEKTVEMYA